MRKKKISILVPVVLGLFICITSSIVRADEVANTDVKPELVVTCNNEDNSISLKWDIKDKDNQYSYRLYSKDKEAVDFQSIPAKSTVKVLNVYPGVGDNLKKWMEDDGYGKGLITVDKIDIDLFNKTPASYLKNSDGTWKYDVVYFGGWNNNNYKDINSESIKVIREFLDAGYGVLFGHDTMASIFPGFWSLKDYLKIFERTTDVGEYTHGVTIKVKVSKKGLLLNYPYKLPNELTIPMSHTSQRTSGDIWMRYEGYPEGANNFYLASWNNCAMIQTGHDEGKATSDEQKILANTLFYLSQVTQETSWTDHKGQDLEAPKKPENLSATRDLDGKVNISYNKAEDIGNTYEYYVQAINNITGEKTKSDTKTVELVSGIKGYSISVDQDPKGVPDGSITTVDNNYSINNNELNGPFYVHIAAIDNAGNVSETSTYKCDCPKLDLTANITEKTHKTVIITAKGTSSDIGIKEIILPNGKIVEGSVAEYNVEKNGVYSFVAVDNNGNITKQSIKIDNILIPVVLNVELPKTEVNLYDEVEVYLSIDNITNIKSEEATIKYDSSKLQFLKMEKTEGQRFIKSSKTPGEIKVILSSADKKALVSGHKVLLKIKFKAKDTGKTLIYVKSGKVSNGLNMERNLFKDECGEEFLTIK